MRELRDIIRAVKFIVEAKESWLNDKCLLFGHNIGWYKVQVTCIGNCDNQARHGFLQPKYYPKLFFFMLNLLFDVCPHRNNSVQMANIYPSWNTEKFPAAQVT